MAVTEDEIHRLRRLVAETAEDSAYTDEMLTEYIEQAGSCGECPL